MEKETLFHRWENRKREGRKKRKGKEKGGKLLRERRRIKGKLEKTYSMSLRSPVSMMVTHSL